MLTVPDKCVNDVIVPRFDAVDAILSRCAFAPETEWVPIEQAYGRVLAMDQFSQHTLPNHLSANRDGVAVYYEYFKDGMPDTSQWKEGREYVFANTGVGIRGDQDTMILIEQVRFDEKKRISFARLPAFKGENTIPVGRDLVQGQLLARKGQTVVPVLAAQLARGGNMVLPVVRKPVVAFLPTGNELVQAGTHIPDGMNAETNSILVRGKLEAWGADPLIFPLCRDNPDELYKTLCDALACADIVLLSAGTSKGTDDHGQRVSARVGEVLMHQVDTGPGKHTSYTIANGKPVVGMSGPPVCCDYTSEWYVKPLIDAFLGRKPRGFPRFRARLLTDLHMTKHNVLFMMGARVMLDADDHLVVVPAASIPDYLELEEKINCFIPMEEGMHCKAGDLVEIELRWPFHSPKKELDCINAVVKDPVSF